MMINRDKINEMPNWEFAEWLCKMMWTDFNIDNPEDRKKYNQVLNFLRSEAEEGENG